MRLQYSVDTVGGEKFALYVRELSTGKMLLSRPIEGTAGDVEWANDNNILFYVTKDSLDRPYKARRGSAGGKQRAQARPGRKSRPPTSALAQVWRHVLGSDPRDDVCVFHEEDEAFYVGISRSRSDQYLMIHTGSAVTSEVRFLRADEPQGDFKPVYPRKQGVEYSVRHRGGLFFVLIRRGRSALRACHGKRGQQRGRQPLPYTPLHPALLHG